MFHYIDQSCLFFFSIGLVKVMYQIGLKCSRLVKSDSKKLTLVVGTFNDSYSLLCPLRYCRSPQGMQEIFFSGSPSEQASPTLVLVQYHAWERSHTLLLVRWKFLKPNHVIVGSNELLKKDSLIHLHDCCLVNSRLTVLFFTVYNWIN